MTITDEPATDRTSDAVNEYVVARRAQLRQRVRQLDARKAGVVAQMRGLVDAYRAAFRTPPARVLLQRLQGGHVYLRWRITLHTGMRILVNAQDEQTQAWIGQIPPTFKPVFLDYMRQSLDLNLLHGMFHVETMRLRQYLKDRQALDALTGAPAS